VKRAVGWYKNAAVGGKQTIEKNLNSSLASSPRRYLDLNQADFGSLCPGSNPGRVAPTNPLEKRRKPRFFPAIAKRGHHFDQWTESCGRAVRQYPDRYRYDAGTTLSRD
jgi:hypothetical protein